jgi:hypothetical protein
VDDGWISLGDARVDVRHGNYSPSSVELLHQPPKHLSEPNNANTEVASFCDAV